MVYREQPNNSKRSGKVRREIQEHTKTEETIKRRIKGKEDLPKETNSKQRLGFYN